MALRALENLVRWNLQIALLVIVAAVLLWVLMVSAPVIRHVFWRAVLVLCLALPLLQPWRAMAVAPVEQIQAVLTAPTIEALEGPLPEGATSSLVRISSRVRAHWIALVSTALVTGAAVRLAWLAVGIVRLRRLRRAGELATTAAEYQELVALIEAGAEIRRVGRLRQPVTFGLFKPIVLLPDSFTALPHGVQRAVLAHELWHVRRRDWAWVLVEETIRAAFWFNPAMWWLVSRVQSSREEVVDQLTVQLTNARKTYLEALLAFADEPTLFPATPFARRRHLFHRMLLISREAVMSSRRIVLSSSAMVAVVLATGLYGSSTFPLVASAVPAVAPAGAAQTPARDRRPREAGPETARERDLKSAIAVSPDNPELYFQLLPLQQARGATSEVQDTIAALRRAVPSSPVVAMQLATFYSRTGQFEPAVAILEEAAAANASRPDGHQAVAAFYFEKAFQDQTLSRTDKSRYVDAGLAAADRALAIDPDYMQSMAYKALLLRMKSSLEPDPVTKQALLAEATGLQQRAKDLHATTGQNAMVFVPKPGPPPPPPPPPPPAGEMDGVTPVRIGGSVPPPTKTKDVKPVYPPIAQASRVQGVVIIEASLGADGKVMSGRVLRGVPLLDEAALDAVRQWEYTPTLLNGAPVPVLMTVTVNFTLPAAPVQ